MALRYAFIVPVYNRPEEIRELLESMLGQTFDRPFQIVIVEDGSPIPSKAIVESFSEKLEIQYLEKPNSGPGDSRNYGMRHAQGDYFIILDSDCLLPPQYLEAVDRSLARDPVDCFGGPDAAHASFSTVQKAINYAMTALWTTGGIRGKRTAIGKFQPRSFNMGLSKEAFLQSGGFGRIHPGEDPDLTIRLWAQGFKTRLIPEAFVYHKRRIDWGKFYTQVHKFGQVRPILNHWHPHTARITYWLPSLFIIGFLSAIVLLGFGIGWPLGIFVLYFLLIFVDSYWHNRQVKVAVLSVWAVVIQFYGYGIGFLKSTFWLTFSRRKPEDRFPKLFFKGTKSGR